MNEAETSAKWQVNLFLRNHLYAGALLFETAADAVESANSALSRGTADQVVITHRQLAGVTHMFTTPQNPDEERAAVRWLESELARTTTSGARARITRQ